jgi:hypothetical protein
MVAIPTLAEEDAKRPNRERESLVGEQTRIVNRMKAALSRLGIRGFNPKLKKAVERLDGLRTPEGEPIPPNTLVELKHDMERRRLVRSQIRDIEGARLKRLDQAPGDGPHVMVRLLARVIGIGVRRRACWCRRCSGETCGTVGQWRATGASLVIMDAIVHRSPPASPTNVTEPYWIVLHVDSAIALRVRKALRLEYRAVLRDNTAISLRVRKAAQRDDSAIIHEAVHFLCRSLRRPTFELKPLKL